MSISYARGCGRVCVCGCGDPKTALQTHSASIGLAQIEPNHGRAIACALERCELLLRVQAFGGRLLRGCCAKSRVQLQHGQHDAAETTPLRRRRAEGKYLQLRRACY